MSYKHQLEISTSASTPSQAKRRTSVLLSSRCNTAFSSSSTEFETPKDRTGGGAIRTSNPFSSMVSSVSRDSADTGTPAPAMTTLTRLSLPPQSSHTTKNSPSKSIAAGNIVYVEDDEEIQRREDADAMNEIIMAFDLKDRDSLGCAYYIAREEKLCMMQDINLANLDMVDTLKLHAQPTVLLISTRADEALENHLSRGARSTDTEGNNNCIYGSYVLNTRKASDFLFEAAKNKIVNLNISNETRPDISFATVGEAPYGTAVHDEYGHIGRQGKLMRLAGWIDLESRLTVGCAGAILSYLQSRRNVEFLPGDDAALVAFRISTIEMFSLSDLMFINADTMVSLQIFQSESHPNSHMQGPSKTSRGAKESLSVFGLFKPLVMTPQGQHRLRQIFLRPSLNLDIIRERQSMITVLLLPSNDPALCKVVKSLKMIKNIRSVIVHLQKGTNGVSKRSGSIKNGIWGSLQGFTYHAILILEALSEMQDVHALSIFQKLLNYVRLDDKAQSQVGQLKTIGQLITSTVDFHGSAEQHRTTVNQGVDAQLDRMKQTYDGLADLLTKVANQVAAEVPEWARHYIQNCIFFPQLGFLTVVPLDLDSGKGLYEGEGLENDVWERKFSSEAMGYFKNKRMAELDNYFGDMYGMICDREIEIIHDLAMQVLKHKELLEKTSDLLGDLDSIVALALRARQYKLEPPRVVVENVIQIVRGRHILQEQTVPSYVENDTFLVGGPGIDEDADETRTTISSQARLDSLENMEGPSMLILTGPNYSGKSVYLKQVAIIVYMAHIGSFIPAESAVIGLTDKLLTRIATRESISKNQSSFMIDLQQVAQAAALSTRRSLILIDEFGKGTNSADGAGLACGVFTHFLTLGLDRPKVIGATHFHEIFENGYLEETSDLSFGHMEVRVDQEAALAEDQLIYLYNLIATRSMASFGTSCAAISGIDPAIIARAEELILLSARGEDLVAACTILTKDDAKKLEQAEQVARQFLEQDLPPIQDNHDSKGDVRRILEDVLTMD